MTGRAAFIYDDLLSRHTLREDHPMVPSRLRLAYELLESYGAFGKPSSMLVTPRQATQKEVMAFHEEGYVKAVESLSRGEAKYSPDPFGFSKQGDNPVYPGMYEAALWSTGASLLAGELLWHDKADSAFSISGGLHHAMPGNASGFCVFNDPVVVIKWLVARGARVAYVDIDCHHGDGVQHAFYDTDAVLTVSLHESGQYLFPGTGFTEEVGSGRGRGYAVNLPLHPYTTDELYLWAFDEIVPPLLEAFKPDVLVTQLGIDTHFLDPITHLALTVQGFAQVVSRFPPLAPKWLALGGGGYDMGAVARAWTLAYGVMLGETWPDEIPPSYQQRYGLNWLRDREEQEVPQDMQMRVRQFAEKSVSDIQRLVFPVHGLG